MVWKYLIFMFSRYICKNKFIWHIFSICITLTRFNNVCCSHRYNTCTIVFPQRLSVWIYTVLKYLIIMVSSCLWKYFFTWHIFWIYIKLAGLNKFQHSCMYNTSTILFPVIVSVWNQYSTVTLKFYVSELHVWIFVCMTHFHQYTKNTWFINLRHN